MPYWRLSGFYFFFFASLGALLPYWGLYLDSLGFSEVAIGNMLAIVMATKIVSPNIWGWIADHTGRRMAIVRLGSLLAALTFLGVFISNEYVWLIIVMMVFSFFWNASLPQFEATTFNHLGKQVHRYSGIRLWGSIGFMVSVWGLGEVLDGQGVHILPWVLFALFAAIWFSSMLVPEEAASHMTPDNVPLRKILTRPEVIGLLLACFFMQAGHGPYYTFYSIYLNNNGYSLRLIGGLWALGVFAEVIIFMLMSRLTSRYSLKNLLIISLILAAIRWLLIGLFVDNLPILVMAQLLHAATFGIYHAAAIQLVHHYFKGQHQGKGQALYSSLSFGAGGAVGSFYSGYVYDYFGAVPMYTIAAILSLVGFIIVWRYIPGFIMGKD